MSTIRGAATKTPSIDDAALLTYVFSHLDGTLDVTPAVARKALLRVKVLEDWYRSEANKIGKARRQLVRWCNARGI